MRTATWIIAVLGVVLAPSVASAAFISVMPTSQVFFENDPTTVATSVDIMVTVGANENIYALRMDIGFDDSVVSSDTDDSDFTVDIADGGMFTDAGGFFLLGDDSTPSLYDDVTGTLIGQTVGLGEGVYTFATVMFTGVDYGTSLVEILDFEAADSNGRVVGLEAGNGSITIRPDGGDIPEPATMAMLAAGLGAMALRRRRKTA